MAALRKLTIVKMGLVKYADALKLQNELVEQRRLGDIYDTLVSLQHPPTFTLGKRRTVESILSSHETLESIGAEIQYCERGGDATYHGPHQAVLYPILCLRELKLGVRRYVEGLEDTMIKLAERYGVKAVGRMPKETGIWVENRKLGAIGVRISSGGISSHGLALNIDPDLTFFSHIIPCGIRDKAVTSLKLECAKELPTDEVVTEELINCFVNIFGYEDVEWREQ